MWPGRPLAGATGQGGGMADGWLEGGGESFVETAAFLAGDWDLADDAAFQGHCKAAFEAGETPEKAAGTWLRNGGRHA